MPFFECRLAVVLIIVALLTFALRSEGQDSAFGSVPRSEYIRVLQNIMNTDGSTVGDEVRQQREQVSFVLFLIENK